jgi:hypothetical protein
MMRDIFRPSVFIGSTWSDLKEHRAVCRDVVLELKLLPIMMEYFAATDDYPVELCLENINQADIYVGIFAHRYGYCPPDSEVSITEIEFNRARAKRIPCLCFIVDENAVWPPAYIEDDPGKSKLLALKKRLDESLVRDTFHNPDSLGRVLSISLHHAILKLSQKRSIPVRQENRNTTKSLPNEAFVEAILSKRLRGF